MNTSETYEDICGDMPKHAKIITEALRMHFSVETEQERQTLNLAEEVGEFVGEARRYMGHARRAGDFGSLSSELADVIIAAYVAGEVFGIDIETEVGKRLRTIYTRGWKEA